MLPLVAAKRFESKPGRKALDRAAAYLSANFREKGAFRDASVVGTGHPGIVYMEYSAYAKTWPVQALGEYRRALAPKIKVQGERPRGTDR